MRLINIYISSRQARDPWHRGITDCGAVVQRGWALPRGLLPPRLGCLCLHATNAVPSPPTIGLIAAYTPPTVVRQQEALGSNNAYTPPTVVRQQEASGSNNAYTPPTVVRQQEPLGSNNAYTPPTPFYHHQNSCRMLPARHQCRFINTTPCVACCLHATYAVLSVRGVGIDWAARHQRRLILTLLADLSFGCLQAATDMYCDGVQSRIELRVGVQSKLELRIGVQSRIEMRVGVQSRMELRVGLTGPVSPEPRHALEEDRGAI